MPIRKVTGNTHRVTGECHRPRSQDTSRIAVPDRKLLDAAHTASASTMSSSATGAFMMDSQVRCVCMRENADHRDFEGGAVHGAGTDDAACQKRNVGHALHLRHQAADAVAERQQVEHRIGQIAQHGRNRELAPHAGNCAARHG